MSDYAPTLLPRETPRVIAHRGMSSLAPENTLAAFRLCAEHGVAWFEFDVDVLGDGTVVVVHDDTLDRTTDHRGSYYRLSAADLPAIDAGSWFSPTYEGEALPTLAQVIDLMNELGLNANLELKAGRGGADLQRSLVEGAARELERLDPERGMIVSSFSSALLSAFHAHAPRWRTGLLFDNRRMSGLWASTAELLNAAALHPGKRRVDKKSVARFREAGYGVNVWTVNSLATAEKLVGWGVTGVFSDRAQDFPEEWRS